MATKKPATKKRGRKQQQPEAQQEMIPAHIQVELEQLRMFKATVAKAFDVAESSTTTQATGRGRGRAAGATKA